MANDEVVISHSGIHMLERRVLSEFIMLARLRLILTRLRLWWTLRRLRYCEFGSTTRDSYLHTFANTLELFSAIEEPPDPSSIRLMIEKAILAASKWPYLRYELPATLIHHVRHCDLPHIFAEIANHLEVGLYGRDTAADMFVTLAQKNDDSQSLWSLTQDSSAETRLYLVSALARLGVAFTKRARSDFCWSWSEYRCEVNVPSGDCSVVEYSVGALIKAIADSNDDSFSGGCTTALHAILDQQVLAFKEFDRQYRDTAKHIRSQVHAAQKEFFEKILTQASYVAWPWLINLLDDDMPVARCASEILKSLRVSDDEVIHNLIPKLLGSISEHGNQDVGKAIQKFALLEEWLHVVGQRALQVVTSALPVTTKMMFDGCADFNCVRRSLVRLMLAYGHEPQCVHDMVLDVLNRARATGDWMCFAVSIRDAAHASKQECVGVLLEALTDRECQTNAMMLLCEVGGPGAVESILSTCHVSCDKETLDQLCKLFPGESDGEHRSLSTLPAFACVANVLSQSGELSFSGQGAFGSDSNHSLNPQPNAEDSGVASAVSLMEQSLLAAVASIASRDLWRLTTIKVTEYLTSVEEPPEYWEGRWSWPRKTYSYDKSRDLRQMSRDELIRRARIAAG